MLGHHAYYIEGSASLFEEYQKALRPFWSGKFERFGIDEARELIVLASLKNFAAATFFVGAASITSEAQQALLKLLEEPQEGTTFVFLLPHGVLLPTLLSRMLPYPDQGQTSVIPRSDLGHAEAREFLGMSGKERSDFIAKMLKDDEGAKERVRDFINVLEAELVKTLQKNAQTRQGLQDIAMVRGYLSDRSPSLKMLLEHLALSLPVI